MNKTMAAWCFICYILHTFLSLFEILVFIYSCVSTVYFVFFMSLCLYNNKFLSYFVGQWTSDSYVRPILPLDSDRTFCVWDAD